MIEDIVLESPEHLVKFVTPPAHNLQIVEDEFFYEPVLSKNSYRFRLINQRFLEIEKRGKKDKSFKSVMFHVGFLCPKAIRVKRSAWFTLLASLLTGIASILIAVYVQDLMISGLTASMSVLLYVMHYYSYSVESQFFSRSGRALVIRFLHRCDNKSELEEFIEKLEKAIEANTLPASSQFFAEENKWHRDLKESRWISDEVYQKAKQRILKQFNRESC